MPGATIWRHWGGSFSLGDSIVDTASPAVTGLIRGADGSWSWGCSESGCQYRSAVNAQRNHQFASESYGSATSLNSPTSSGTYYVHVQARDMAGNESPVESSAAFEVTAPGPAVVSVAGPAADVYNSGELEFTVTFAGAVTVSGAPSLGGATIGGASRVASYRRVGNDGTEQIFGYTIQAGDNGAVALGGSIDLNGGSILDSTNNQALLTLAGVSDLSGVVVDTQAPVLTGVSATAGLSGANQTVVLTATFDESVTISGSPSLGLIIGGTTANAPYTGTPGVAGTEHSFEYITGGGQNGAVNVVGIAFGGAGGGGIEDAAGNRAPTTVSLTVSGVTVDTEAPTVTAVARGADGSWSWGCSESGCQYRSAVNAQRNHQFASESYGSATSLNSPTSSRYLLRSRPGQRCGGQRVAGGEQRGL